MYNYFYYSTNLKNLVINLTSYESKLWNYVHILNNNNNSIIFFFILLLLMVYYFNIFKFFKLNIIYNFLFFIVFINLLEKKIHVISFFVQKFINIILNNGVILIHPLCMYICYCLFLILIFLFLKKTKNNWFIILNFNKFKKKLIFFSFNALFLGSY